MKFNTAIIFVLFAVLASLVSSQEFVWKSDASAATLRKAQMGAYKRGLGKRQTQPTLDAKLMNIANAAYNVAWKISSNL